jgi:hypothetical protein
LAIGSGSAAGAAITPSVEARLGVRPDLDGIAIRCCRNCSWQFATFALEAKSGQPDLGAGAGKSVVLELPRLKGVIYPAEGFNHKLSKQAKVNGIR